MRKLFYIILLSLSALGAATAQVLQDFNKSVNQIGNCWQWENMYIETQNTINKANERKALTGGSPVGSPAYSFVSPLVDFTGGGTMEFRHKLTDNDGVERVLRVYLLDQAEKVVQTLYTYVYRTGNTSPNGNATNVVNVNIPITWQGIHIIKWEWEGVGGTSVGMVDDISIDGDDVSDGSNDNGYGYCREDDEVFDTVCAGTKNWELKVPYVIEQSEWAWDFYPAAAVGSIDSTIVDGPKDSLIHVNWNYEPGSYIIEATEIRPPHNTTTYSITFYIEVLDFPSVDIAVDPVCYPEQPILDMELNGTGPWTVTYTDGTDFFTETFTDPAVNVRLPNYSGSKTITVTDIVDATGCRGNPAEYPSALATIFPRPSTGLIQK